MLPYGESSAQLIAPLREYNQDAQALDTVFTTSAYCRIISLLYYIAEISANLRIAN